MKPQFPVQPLLAAFRPEAAIPQSATAVRQSRSRFFTQCLRAVLTAGCLTSACFDSPAAGEKQSALEFFKEALRSPPDVESFLGKEAIIRERTPNPAQAGPTNRAAVPIKIPFFYHGARSGSNYFLRQLYDTNAATVLFNSPMAAGRNREKSFHLNPNTVTYSHYDQKNPKGDPVQSMARSLYTMLCQFLNMGFGDLLPETVVWEGNQFTAKRAGDWPVFGQLEVVDGLPAVLSISAKKSDPPFKSYAYHYPDPPLSLGGFPSKIVVSVLFEDGLNPWVELSFIQVRVAREPLPAAFFDEKQFLSTNISYVNFFTNGILYGLQSDGRMVKIQGAVPQSTKSFRGRLLFYVALAALAVTPVIFLTFYKRKPNEAKVL